MKNAFSFLAVALFFGSSLNLSANIVVKIPSCGEVCLSVVDAYESEYGCMDAEDTTELYQVLYSHYCN